MFFEGRVLNHDVGKPRRGDYSNVKQLIFPMQLIENLDMERVAFYQRQMADGVIPTTLAVGRIDFRAAFNRFVQNESVVHKAGCAITLQTFLVDGHHKLYAAGKRSYLPLLLSC